MIKLIMGVAGLMALFVLATPAQAFDLDSQTGGVEKVITVDELDTQAVATPAQSVAVARVATSPDAASLARHVDAIGRSVEHPRGLSPGAADCIASRLVARLKAPNESHDKLERRWHRMKHQVFDGVRVGVRVGLRATSTPRQSSKA